MYKTKGVIFLSLIATLILTTQTLPLYDCEDEDSGNSIDSNTNRVPLQSNSGETLYLKDDDDVTYQIKRNPGIKRNIISALRAKMRRSKTFHEDKGNFAPILSVDALGNLNDFFNNLAGNLMEMENRNLLPYQMKLLGKNESRSNKLHPSFISAVRSYNPKHIRTLLQDYEPDFHRNSNYFDPVLSRIGLGKK